MSVRVSFVMIACFCWLVKVSEEKLMYTSFIHVMYTPKWSSLVVTRSQILLRMLKCESPILNSHRLKFFATETSHEST